MTKNPADEPTPGQEFLIGQKAEGPRGGWGLVVAVSADGREVTLDTGEHDGLASRFRTFVPEELHRVH